MARNVVVDKHNWYCGKNSEIVLLHAEMQPATACDDDDGDGRCYVRPGLMLRTLGSCEVM